MKLLIGIPAFNESKTVGDVVKTLPKKLKNIDKIDVLMVDDGSTDNTAETGRKNGAIMVKHLLNRGLGAALNTVLTFAREENYDILVTFDADGQHNPDDIEKMINPILKNGFDVVIGSRWIKKYPSPFSRKLVNKIANLFTLLLSSIKVSDSQSGLRAFNKKALKTISLHTDGMEVSSEFFQEIQRNKLSLREIPIKPIYTTYSLSKGQKLTNAYNIFMELLIRLFR